MFEHSTKIRVRYGETDQMGYMYYGNYAEFFEVGRVEMLRSLGLTYRWMEEVGIMMPVLELKCRYLKPALYDEEISIKVTMEKMPSIKIHFKYELFNETNSEQIIAQQTKYETEIKETEIKILKQQEEIKSLQIKEKDILLQKRKYLLFTSLVIIILLVFVGYFYFSSQKIKSLQKQEQVVRETEENERLRIAKDIHDDLGSGLSKIKFLTELVSAKSANNPEVTSNIKSIAETSVFLVENMRDLIWALNPENTKLETLIARIREYSSDYLADFPLELKINISDEIPDKEITKEAHRNIFFIVKESLQNIIKHANASVVQLTIDVINNEFKMIITDNGKGLTIDDSKEGNGLRNIKQRAAVINSVFEINSQQGNGTSISIITPIKNIEKA